ncbi:MAG: hypothetical protein WAT23_13765 [Chromatiaceae bacterium]
MSAGWYKRQLASDAMVKLAFAGITLRLEDDGRIFAGPAGKLTPELRQLITAHKEGMVLELSPPRERELRLHNHELEVRAHELEEKAHQLERAIDFEKCTRQVYQGLATAAMEQLRQPHKSISIPADIHRTLVSLCHPDRNPERQSAATLAMKWLNQQRKEECRP